MQVWLVWVRPDLHPLYRLRLRTLSHFGGPRCGGCPSFPFSGPPTLTLFGRVRWSRTLPARESGSHVIDCGEIPSDQSHMIPVLDEFPKLPKVTFGLRNSAHPRSPKRDTASQLHIATYMHTGGRGRMQNGTEGARCRGCRFGWTGSGPICTLCTGLGSALLAILVAQGAVAVLPFRFSSHLPRHGCPSPWPGDACWRGGCGVYAGFCWHEPRSASSQRWQPDHQARIFPDVAS